MQGYQDCVLVVYIQVPPGMAFSSLTCQMTNFKQSLYTGATETLPTHSNLPRDDRGGVGKLFCY